MNMIEARRAVATRELAGVAAFALLCTAIFGFLWVNSGGRVPFKAAGYELTASVPRVGNLVYFSDVMVAGVKVGKVTEVKPEGDHARVTFRVDKDMAPLHEGTTLTVGAKSLVEESYLDVTDGSGAQLAAGTRLPDGAAKAPVQLDDVYRSLDPRTRDAASELLQSTGSATTGRREDIAAAAAGLGLVGRDGTPVLTALAQQSDQLDDVARNSARMLAALGSRREAITALVDRADQITQVTAGSADDVRAVVRALPDTLGAVDASQRDVQQIADALSPVARNLKAAAPDLAAALQEVPATTKDLRALLPSLHRVIRTSPTTFSRVPPVSGDVRSLVPEARRFFSDVNPMLAYLSPYGKDAAAWFSNFAATVSNGDANGKFFRMMVSASDQSVFGIPVSTNIGPLNRLNPIPGAGTLQSPKPFTGTYPRVHKEKAPQ
jgi:phospholipid/cholesterol/gamma-HCH transport system substrate-binding protein